MVTARRCVGVLGGEGIEIKDIYWTIGPYDLVGVVEAPSGEVLTKALLALGAGGHVRTTTLRAFDQDEFSRLI
jgi:uncharacterized protein with GYD domain